jgi:hypothetical protein
VRPESASQKRPATKFCRRGSAAGAGAGGDDNDDGNDDGGDDGGDEDIPETSR